MRDAAHTKDLIAETALRLFVEKGIKETTIRDIAKAAGIAEGTLYRHYASKEELAWDLFLDNFTTFARELTDLRARYGTFRERLDAMVRHFCSDFDVNPMLFSYVLLQLHGLAKKVGPDVPNPMTVLRDVIAEGMAQGEIPKGDPDVAAAMVSGLVLQLAVFKILGRIEQSFSSLSDTVAAAAWRVLAG